MQDFILEGVLKQCKKQEEDMVTDRQERSSLNAVVFKAEFGFNSLRPVAGLASQWLQIVSVQGWFVFTEPSDVGSPVSKSEMEEEEMF